MIAELGHFALILAAALALFQAVVPQVGAIKGWHNWMEAGQPAAVIQALLVAFSFAALTHAFVISDFSLQLVVSNSHTDKPLIYKISGVWGNHEGSMLLWLLILALYGGAAAIWGKSLPATLQARVLSVQAAVSFAFYAFILITSNPFERVAPGAVPFNGFDLNPLLQDPGLAFHPPFLYLGYVGLSMTYSFAVAALLEGRVDAAWGRWVRPWTLAAWLFLTIGIALGSWWAYYELGWSGFWFWDPVENASFMPWLIAAALLHSAIVTEKREALKSWTILLAIIAFGFSLIGTFIVRSGLITSVHSFASDPLTGTFILGILVVFTGGALVLFSLRAEVLGSTAVFKVVSREGALVLNNIFLAVSAALIFIGTMWPLAAELFFGAQISAGAPFFNAVFTPFAVALAVLLPVGSMLPWKRGTLQRHKRDWIAALVLAFCAGALTYAIQSQTTILGPVGMALGIWVIFGAGLDLWSRTGKSGVSRLWRLPRADWGKAVAHFGFGITILGIAGTLAWSVTDRRAGEPGETYTLGRYEFTLRGFEQGVEGPNFIATQATMDIRRSGAPHATLVPELRFYPAAQQSTTEAAILNGVFHDLYVVIGERQTDGRLTIHTHIKPLANWIWAGAILMSLGGILSLSDRRHRIAAGAAKRVPKAVEA